MICMSFSGGVFKYQLKQDYYVLCCEKERGKRLKCCQATLRVCQYVIVLSRADTLNSQSYINISAIHIDQKQLIILNCSQYLLGIFSSERHNSSISPNEDHRERDKIREGNAIKYHRNNGYQTTASCLKISHKLPKCSPTCKWVFHSLYK